MYHFDSVLLIRYNFINNTIFIFHFSAGASVVSAVYGSLVVDYRLLCLLLYIELALEVDVWKSSEEVNKNSETEEEHIQQIQQQQVKLYHPMILLGRRVEGG